MFTISQQTPEHYYRKSANSILTSSQRFLAILPNWINFIKTEEKEKHWQLSQERATWFSLHPTPSGRPEQWIMFLSNSGEFYLLALSFSSNSNLLPVLGLARSYFKELPYNYYSGFLKFLPYCNRIAQ